MPSQKAEGQEGNDLLGASLKYLGLGAKDRQDDKNPEAAAEEGEASSVTPSKQPSKGGWSGFSRGVGQQARRKSVAQQQEADDDKKVRFTIGGVGQRMTKEDFIKEVQKLDVGTRKEVVDHSTASSAVKQLARQDPLVKPAGLPVVPVIREQGSETSSSNGESSRTGRGRSQSTSPGRRPAAASSPSPSSKDRQMEEFAETSVERKRRLAVLASQAEADDEDADTGETPAERRRRQAALGVANAAAVEDSDSDDEGTERVPPARRGIRFAEPQRSGKQPR